MKVKALIEVLSNLPEEMEVVLERRPDDDYEAIPVVGAEVDYIKIGEHLCDGNECGMCDVDGYCVHDDRLRDDLEEHVILKLNEEYEEIRSTRENRNYYWYNDRNNDKGDKMENGINMLNMHFVSKQDAFKYNLEKEEMSKYGSLFTDHEYIWTINNTDWWVVGINTQTNIVYAQIDQLNFGAIQDLELNDYALVGVVEEFQPGMISTRDSENPIKDIKDFIQTKKVYKLQYGGI